MGKVLCCCLDLSSRPAPLWMFLLTWDHEGPQCAKRHFKYYEVGANRIVLLIELCLWEGAVFLHFFVAKVFCSPRGPFCEEVTIRPCEVDSLQKYPPPPL